MGMGYQPVQRGTINFNWIQESWQIFMQNPVTWALSTLIVGAIIAVIGGILGTVFGLGTFLGMGGAAASMDANGNPSPAGGFAALAAAPMLWVVGLIVAAAGSFFYAGYLRMAIAAVKGEPIAINMLFQGGPYTLPFFLVQLAVGFAAGIVGCTVVGPIIVVGLLAPALVLAADGASAGDALSKSFNAMKPHWLMAALFFLAMMVIVYISALILGLGTLVTVPMLAICAVFICRDIIGLPGLESAGAGGAQPGQWPPPPTFQQAPPQDVPPPVATYAPPVQETSFTPPAESVQPEPVIEETEPKSEGTAGTP